jgi:hypothetical protein
LIGKIDERLTENYHPLNWAQVLKPVFDLAGPSVDANLIQIFFDDKEKPGYAQMFGQLNENLNETELIEVLSSADLLDIEEDENEKSEAFGSVEEESKPEIKTETEDSAKEEQLNTTEEEESAESGPRHEEILVESSEDIEKPEK